MVEGFGLVDHHAGFSRFFLYFPQLPCIISLFYCIFYCESSGSKANQKTWPILQREKFGPNISAIRRLEFALDLLVIQTILFS